MTSFHSDTDAQVARTGSVACEVLRAARLGVPGIDVRCALKSLQSANDEMERRLAERDPAAYADLMAEADRIHAEKDAAMQAEIRQIVKQRGLDEMIERIDFYRSCMRSGAKETPTSPLPTRFEPAVRFAMTKLHLFRSQLPDIKMADEGLDGVPPRATGVYSRRLNTIRIRVGMTDEETLKTLFHELSHAADRHRGRPMDEDVTRYMEEKLYAEWLRTDQSRWAA